MTEIKLKRSYILANLILGVEIYAFVIHYKYLVISLSHGQNKNPPLTLTLRVDIARFWIQSYVLIVHSAATSGKDFLTLVFEKFGQEERQLYTNEYANLTIKRLGKLLCNMYTCYEINQISDHRTVNRKFNGEVGCVKFLVLDVSKAIVGTKVFFKIKCSDIFNLIEFASITSVIWYRSVIVLTKPSTRN